MIGSFYMILLAINQNTYLYFILYYVNKITQWLLEQQLHTEMHPWYSRRVNNFDSCKENALNEEKCELNRPDFIVFDLDPYIY
jgi:bifunctional non-homologous end joining protein LigD